ncbi:MAG: sugar phosphate isomerase/epimerase [Candidatus Nezhaarchaeota archaeon]|nr:sugar phosphate isomerase/epimerase [Candidatus Nezhaarchaeota archaeon]MCX8142354.1 sugar phosphate isomerase/epimerase [Candidatus Nezhaarchaeota archaeon]MDW8050673.1 sugar phosphate isomerase/epimerase family protein [Nitrososphaerota archaeon]
MALIGFPLWLGDRKRLATRIRETLEAGFDFVELSFDYPWPIPDSSTPRSIAKAVQDAGLSLAIHGSWRDVRLASPIDHVREASVKYLIETLEIARELDPMYILFHVSTDQAIREAQEYEDVIIKAATSSTRTILKAALEMGLTAFFENIPSQFCGSIDHVKKIFMDVEEAKLCFDIGHAQAYMVRANRGKGVNIQEVVDQWFRELGALIRGVHVYDCLAQGKWIDEHIAPTISSPSIKALVTTIDNTKTRLDFVVIEAFQDREGNDARPASLDKVVEYLKRSL